MQTRTVTKIIMEVSYGCFLLCALVMTAECESCPVDWHSEDDETPPCKEFCCKFWLTIMYDIDNMKIS